MQVVRLRSAAALGIPRGAGLRARPSRAARRSHQPSCLRQPPRTHRQAGNNSGIILDADYKKDICSSTSISLE